MGTANLLKPEKSEKKSLYFSKEMFVLKLCGASLSGNQGTAQKVCSYLAIFLTLFLYPLLEFAEFFKHDLGDVASIIPYQNAGLIALAKTIVLIRNRLRLRKILTKLEEEPFLPDPNRGGHVEEALIKECLWLTRLQTFTYWILSAFIVGGAVLFTLFKRITSNDYHDWKFGFGPFTPLNVTYSPNFELCWVYQNVAIIHTGALFTSMDVLLSALLAHVSYQFKILQNYLRRLVKISYEKMIKDYSTLQPLKCYNPDNKFDGSVVPWKYLKESVRNAVVYHLQIINIANELEEIFSKLLLSTFLGTLTLICFSVFRVSAFDDKAGLIQHITEAICSAMQIVTVCYWGEQVLQESQNVGFAAYEPNFVGTDVRFQNDLTFIIRRSQNPIKLTTGGFADVCLTTFAWIMRMSYSAFMIIQGRNKRN